MTVHSKYKFPTIHLS